MYTHTYWQGVVDVQMFRYLFTNSITLYMHHITRRREGVGVGV